MKSLRPFFLSVLFLSVLNASDFSYAQSPHISYLLPDIGTTEMNTYVEFIGPYDQNGNFGADGISLNNPGDALRLVCLNASDSTKIKIGPLIVSWDGRMIATQIFVNPDVKPNSADWEQLSGSYRIPVVAILNGVASNADTFYIVKPWPAITASNSGVLGSGGSWGKRSRRGAMIVDSMSLRSGTYTISTSDCDAGTPGNQGYLPVVIISPGPVTINTGAQLSANSSGRNAGPGGGGGGGQFDDGWTGGTTTPGGDGFTGGQGTPYDTGGNGTGGVGEANSHGGKSLNGVPGPIDKPGSGPWYGSEGGQGTGGGTGFCFGSGGEGNRSAQCFTSDIIGGFGGGSGAGECYPTSFGGGGGGFGTVGTATTCQGGQINDNRMIVPVAGGSGGSGGNPWYGQAGSGGGGGGFLGVHSASSLHISSVNSSGNAGEDQLLQEPGHFSGAGGGGAGGGIMTTSKLETVIYSFIVKGGAGGGVTTLNTAEGNHQYGGEGGSGRVRADGPLQQTGNFTAGASNYRGPSTDTSHFVSRTFILTGSGDGNLIRLYLASEQLPWQLIATVSGYQNNSWTQEITLPGSDSLYYLVAAQEVLSPSQTAFVEESSIVLSQAGANILLTAPVCEATILMYPERLYHGYLNHSVTVPFRVSLSNSINTDSLLGVTSAIHYQLDFDTSILQVSTVTPPAGWAVQSQQVTNGSITVRLVKANGMTHTFDSLGEVTFNVISAVHKHSVINLSDFEMEDSSGIVPFCIYASEGDAWVVLIDSIQSGVAYRSNTIRISEIFPNPAANEARVSVDLPSSESVTTEGFDILGSRIPLLGSTIRAKRGSSSLSIKTNDLLPGVYFLRIAVGETIVARRLRITR